MIDELKKLLKDAVIDRTNKDSQGILQYKVSNGEVIFLNQNRLSNNEIDLLNLFLTPIPNTSLTEKIDQQFWKAVVSGDRRVLSDPPITAPFYQLFHFYINGEIQDDVEFSNAMENLFTTEITLVWNSKNDGFIVIYITDEDFAYEDDAIVEAIIADFYVQISLYKGSRFSNLEEAYSLFQWEKSAFSLARKVLPNETVTQKEQLIPHLLANEVSTETKKRLLQTINLLQEDKELLKTVKIFFECNLNTTLAAKKLFMHRNSLQYRIDKFIEKTGIDIKQFQQAAAMYMLIALNEIKS